MTPRQLCCVLTIMLGFISVTGDVFAQDPDIKRMVLQRTDVPNTIYECVFGLAELAPGTSIGRHTHNGVEVGYVAAGILELKVEGQETYILRAGDSYTIPAGTIHDAKNTGNSIAKAMATWVVEKGKPLSQPAP